MSRRFFTAFVAMFFAVVIGAKAVDYAPIDPTLDTLQGLDGIIVMGNLPLIGLGIPNNIGDGMVSVKLDGNTVIYPDVVQTNSTNKLDRLLYVGFQPEIPGLPLGQINIGVGSVVALQVRFSHDSIWENLFILSDSNFFVTGNTKHVALEINELKYIHVGYVESGLTAISIPLVPESPMTIGELKQKTGTKTLIGMRGEKFVVLPDSDPVNAAEGYLVWSNYYQMFFVAGTPPEAKITLPKGLSFQGLPQKPGQYYLGRFLTESTGMNFLVIAHQSDEAQRLGFRSYLINRNNPDKLPLYPFMGGRAYIFVNFGETVEVPYSGISWPEAVDAETRGGVIAVPEKGAPSIQIDASHQGQEISLSEFGASSPEDLVNELNQKVLGLLNLPEKNVAVTWASLKK